MAGSIVGVSLALAISAGGWCNYTNMNDAIDPLNASQVTPQTPEQGFSKAACAARTRDGRRCAQSALSAGSGEKLS